jgi:hypothetical protein
VTISLRSFLNVPGTVFTPSNFYDIFAEDLNAIKKAVGGGYLNPLTLLLERDGIDTLDLKVNGTQRIDALGVATLSDCLPDSDNMRKLGGVGAVWQECRATTFYGSGAGISGILPSPTSGKYLRANGAAWLAATLSMADVGAGTLFSDFGGTGFNTYTTGDILYAASVSLLGKLNIGTVGQVLTVPAGPFPIPTWTALPGISFSGLTSGTNTIAAMLVGTGASLARSGTGTISASDLLGKTWAIPDPLGATTPNTVAASRLTMSGGANLAHRSTAISTTAAITDSIISVTAVPATITLPTAASAGAGFVLIVKDSSGAATGGSPITIDGDGAETIDGALTKTIIAAWGAISIYSTGTAWRIF